MTVDSFSGNTATTGTCYPSARFRFGESSDNDRQRLHALVAARFSNSSIARNSSRRRLLKLSARRRIIELPLSPRRRSVCFWSLPVRAARASGLRQPPLKAFLSPTSLARLIFPLNVIAKGRLPIFERCPLPPVC